MRYLPLTSSDRAEMLSVIGAGSVDDLFVDVPESARLSGPIEGLPNHASELAVEPSYMEALATSVPRRRATCVWNSNSICSVPCAISG